MSGAQSAAVIYQTIIEECAAKDPLDPNGTYSLLVNNFMYAGGDDYTILAQSDPNAYDTGINWRQPVIDTGNSITRFYDFGQRHAVFASRTPGTTMHPDNERRVVDLRQIKIELQ